MEQIYDEDLATIDVDDVTVTVTLDFDNLSDLNENLPRMFENDPDGALHNLEIIGCERAVEQGLIESDEIKYTNLVVETEQDGKRVDELKTADHDRLVQIDATVEQVYAKKPITIDTVWRCVVCGTRHSVSQYTVDGQIDKPHSCVSEDCNNTAQSKFKIIEEEEVEQTRQLIKLSDDATADRQGEDILTHLYPPLLDSVEVGETVTVTAIPRTYREQKNDAVKERELVALGIDNEQESIEVSDEERERFEEIVESGDAEDLLLESLAPHIVGEEIEDFKQGVLAAVVSGDVEWMDRSDMNIIGIGSPAVGKTKILEFVEESVNRSKMVEGSGSSKAGLLGFAKEDETKGGWYAHSGPFFRYRDVMMDEVADMNPEEMQGMKSALEHQSYSITSGGVDQELTTTGSFIGASNPIDGKFNEHEALDDQFNFDPALLSRFGLIYIIQDNQDEETDKQKATAMMTRWQEAAADETDHDRLTKTEFGKFVEYLKESEPSPPSEDVVEFVASEFASLRADDSDHIDLRKLPTIMRLATVFARLNGHDQIEKQDMTRGAEMLIDSVNRLDEANIDKSVLWTGENSEQTEAKERVVDAVDTLHHADDDDPTRTEVEKRIVMNHQLDQETVRWAIESRLEDDALYEGDDGVLHTTKN
ncbi:minichromosome maintenance protein MCM [Halosimplex rubrum]|uniref:Minichromosome maintenance protein MCM n=1 Tax=Halosimplex rubrum TaxID=869889 RepID=A0A7D5P5Z2_9EURY|nr:minichromosome maintenance protein MCM [Halosimplex rubrum]QLH78162.1 minichromosome maintenance protein MCM [Halosimplex rubrum]